MLILLQESVIFQRLIEQDLQILMQTLNTHKYSQNFRRIQSKSLRFFELLLLISVLNWKHIWKNSLATGAKVSRNYPSE